MSCRSCLRPARRCCIVQRRCTARTAACRSHPNASAALRRYEEVRLTLQVQAARRLLTGCQLCCSEQCWGPSRHSHIIQTLDGLQSGSSTRIL